MSPDSATINLGDTLQFEATVLGFGGGEITDREVEWISTDTLSVKIDEQGQAAAFRGSIVGIIARLDDVDGRAKLRVLGRVDSVIVSPDDLQLLKGDTAHLVLSVVDRVGNELTDRQVTWESSDSSVATVSSTGVVTAVEEGSATVTAVVEGKSGSASVFVALPIVFALLDAGGNHTCGVSIDSVAFCWGAGGSGQLAQSVSSRDTPGEIVSAFPLSLTLASAGGAHTCAIDENGAGWCWGSNSNGQVGGPADVPVDPARVTGGLTFASLSAGESHSCGITTANEAYCWGLNDDGQLGDQTNTGRFAPVQVFGGLSFAQLSAGGSHTCGVTTGNVAYCWGLNDRGQLGDGGNADSSEPQLVSGGHSFTQVSAGGAHSCGLTTGGVVLCWGANDQNQLGDGTSSDRSTPVTVSGGLSFSDVAAGGSHTCAVVPDETVYCWGLNSFGQLGDGSTTSRSVPTSVSGTIGFASVTAGGSHSCGVTFEPVAYCWGLGFAGQLGIGDVGLSGLRDTPSIVEGQK